MAVTTVAMFPSVLGVRAGVRDAADRMRQAGHAVLIADLYDGRVFDDYEPAMAFAMQDVGLAELRRRADASIAHLPDGFVAAGFSLGCVMAVHVATRRPVAGVLMLAGAIPVSELGDGVTWPAGVPAQTHAMLDDPWRDAAEVTQARVDVETGGGRWEQFDYPGSGHLFTDPTLPAEFDPVATELLYERVLAFLANLA